VLLNLIADGDELQAAVDRARIHHQWMPDVLFVEPYAVSPDTAKVLERRGHELRVVNELGEVSAVRGVVGGLLMAAQDPRGPGSGGVVKPEMN
jgi:gamma-glutamyltranspeptidase/glutathione hydrolase